jgi:hypothetical protein
MMPTENFEAEGNVPMLDGFPAPQGRSERDARDPKISLLHPLTSRVPVAQINRLASSKPFAKRRLLKAED